MPGARTLLSGSHRPKARARLVVPQQRVAFAPIHLAEVKLAKHRGTTAWPTTRLAGSSVEAASGSLKLGLQLGKKAAC